MKNYKQGFVVPLLIAIIAVLAIGGVIYLYSKSAHPDTVIQSTTSENTFSASPVSGQAPLTVKFTNTIKSAGDISIDYGDGTSCSTANPDGSQSCSLYTHIYAKAGTYTAILYSHLPTMELARITINAIGKSVSAPISVTGMRQYIDTNFGFSFWYPSGWQVSETPVLYPNKYLGGTVLKQLNIGDGQKNTIDIEEFSSPTFSITDSTGSGACPICNTTHYYFDATLHTWMAQYPNGSSVSASTNPAPANVSFNTMGGLHMLAGSQRFGTNTIIPLSAKNFLVVTVNGAIATESSDPQALTKTIVATDPSVAIPVDISQQIKIIQNEAAAYLTTYYVPISGWKEYIFGNDFKFEYPPDWNLTKSSDGKSVTVSSGVLSEHNGVDSGIMTEQITFSTVDKSFFSTPVQTKVGSIGYDENHMALVDVGESPNRCLPSTKLLQAQNAVLSFNYGGSTMSDPAYFEYAVLTQNKNIILVTELSEPGSDQNQNTKNHDEVSQIARSFSLLDGNTVRVPTCSVN